MSKTGDNRWLVQINFNFCRYLTASFVICSMMLSVSLEEPYQFAFIDLRLYNYFVIFDRQIIFSSSNFSFFSHSCNWNKCLWYCYYRFFRVFCHRCIVTFDRFIWHQPYCWHIQCVHMHSKKWHHAFSLDLNTHKMKTLFSFSRFVVWQLKDI